MHVYTADGHTLADQEVNFFNCDAMAEAGGSAAAIALERGVTVYLRITDPDEIIDPVTLVFDP